MIEAGKKLQARGGDMGAPERIWTASTEGKCHVGFDTPSMNYTIEYIRADLAAPDLAELVEAATKAERIIRNGQPDKITDAADMLAAALAKIKEPQHG